VNILLDSATQAHPSSHAFENKCRIQPSTSHHERSVGHRCDGHVNLLAASAELGAGDGWPQPIGLLAYGMLAEECLLPLVHYDCYEFVVVHVEPF
jgi:hypothetical protein